MSTLLEDLDDIIATHWINGVKHQRLRAFIEQHQPWYPPRKPGFGPWIEYDGKNGPMVDEEVMILTIGARREKSGPQPIPQFACIFDWHLHPSRPSHIVAYCVKEDQP